MTASAGDHAGHAADRSGDVGRTAGVGLDQDVRSKKNRGLLIVGGKCTEQRRAVEGQPTGSRLAPKRTPPTGSTIEHPPISAHMGGTSTCRALSFWGTKVTDDCQWGTGCWAV